MYNKISRKAMYKYLVPLVLINSIQAASYDNKLELGVKTTFYNYTERNDQDEILDTEKSSLFDTGGLYASYDHKLKEFDTEDGSIAHYINAYASAVYGDTEYKGSILGSGQGYGSYVSTTANSFYEYQLNIKRVQFYKNSSRYISFGFGYKEWERELSTTQVENYHYDFAQIKVGGDTLIYDDISLGLDLGAQLAFNPEMDADFTSGTGLHETFNLGTTYSYLVSVPLQIPIQDELVFVARAEYEFTSIGKSDAIAVPDFPNQGDNYSFLEPKSQQKNWHFFAGLQLHF